MTELATQVEEMQHQHQLEKNDLLNDINQKTKEIHDLRAALEEQIKLNQQLAQDRDYWKDHFDSVQQRQQNDSSQANSQINGRNVTATLYQPAASDDNHSPAHHSSGFHGYGTPIGSEVAGGCGDCKPGDCACINKMADDMKEMDNVFDATYMPAVPLPRRNGRSNVDEHSGILA